MNDNSCEPMKELKKLKGLKRHLETKKDLEPEEESRLKRLTRRITKIEDGEMDLSEKQTEVIYDLYNRESENDVTIYSETVEEEPAYFEIYDQSENVSIYSSESSDLVGKVEWEDHEETSPIYGKDENEEEADEDKEEKEDQREKKPEKQKGRYSGGREDMKIEERPYSEVLMNEIVTEGQVENDTLRMMDSRQSSKIKELVDEGKVSLKDDIITQEQETTDRKLPVEEIPKSEEETESSSEEVKRKKEKKEKKKNKEPDDPVVESIDWMKDE